MIPNVSDKRLGIVSSPQVSVFCPDGLHAFFCLEFSYLGGWQDLCIELTRIKEKPGTDDGQRSSLPLRKN